MVITINKNFADKKNIYIMTIKQYGVYYGYKQKLTCQTRF